MENAPHTNSDEIKSNTPNNVHDDLNWPTRIYILCLIIYLLLSCAYLLYVFCQSAKADEMPAETTDTATAFVHAVEMNCRDQECLIYLAREDRQKSFLRIVLSNGDDNATTVGDGAILDAVKALDCQYSSRCAITASRYDSTVIIKISRGSHEKALLLFVPILNDE